MASAWALVRWRHNSAPVMRRDCWPFGGGAVSGERRGERSVVVTRGIVTVRRRGSVGKSPVARAVVRWRHNGAPITRRDRGRPAVGLSAGSGREVTGGVGACSVAAQQRAGHAAGLLAVRRWGCHWEAARRAFRGGHAGDCDRSAAGGGREVAGGEGACSVAAQRRADHATGPWPPGGGTVGGERSGSHRWRGRLFGGGTTARRSRGGAVAVRRWSCHWEAARRAFRGGHAGDCDRSAVGLSAGMVGKSPVARTFVRWRYSIAPIARWGRLGGGSGATVRCRNYCGGLRGGERRTARKSPVGLSAGGRREVAGGEGACSVAVQHRADRAVGPWPFGGGTVGGERRGWRGRVVVRWLYSIARVTRWGRGRSAVGLSVGSGARRRRWRGRLFGGGTTARRSRGGAG
jgi:hypothetical protein